jgi:putative heme-binding domain-containing protein
VKRLPLLLPLCLAACLARGAEDPFAAGVRDTEPLTPAEQRKTFRLPPGFEIQLVATEPDIHKPMNLAFDAAGRLWVTTSIEYPWAAPTNRPGRDRVMIFDDFGPDGRARKITEFACGLNIPIGVYPFRTDTNGWKAIVWSIPHLWLMEDTDGDSRADRRTPLYGPFDYSRDTHGNLASFRRGFDGWLYGTHGFNNDSWITNRDGSVVHLNSGNTWRARLDGSRLEHHTHGQVNPFGLAWDPRGNLYSSDCHSAPIYQLLAGGFYPSFGKPHDGLGFAPVMLEHAHGSTAIDGAFYYADDLWPAEYRDTFLIGNVMTSRLNRDRIEFIGSTPKAVEQPDFLTTSDPWFRPVDNALGPDGALYVADFYNRIIGHYEVPLTHPGRDRERGRLWRVVYRGETRLGETQLGETQSPASPSFPSGLRPAALPTDLLALQYELMSPNLTRRLLAMAEIEDRFGTNALAKLGGSASGFWHFRGEDNRTLLVAHSLWLLHRLDGALLEPLTKAAADEDPLLRTHALRIVAERSRAAGPAAEPLLKLALAGLRDTDALVRRCAAEAVGASPVAAREHADALLDALAAADPRDTHLVYVLRKAVRDLLRRDPVLTDFAEKPAAARDLAVLRDLVPAVNTAAAGRFALRLAAAAATPAPPRARLLQHAARHAPAEDVDRLAATAQAAPAADVDADLALFRSVQQGLAQRGLKPSDAVLDWAESIATNLLPAVRPAALAWRNVPLDAAPNAASPWDWQERRQADTGADARMLSSLPRGESLTGVLRSRPFKAPPSLSFFLAGHDGPPDAPPRRRNLVRLVAADTGDVLLEAPPPRNDTAQRVTWDLRLVAGRDVRLEVVDGDAGGAYAWLAFGRLEPAVVPWPALPPAVLAERQAAFAELAQLAEADQWDEALNTLARHPDADLAARAAALRALAALEDAPEGRAAADLIGDAALPAAWRQRFADAALGDGDELDDSFLPAVWREAPRRFQARLAAFMAQDPAGLLEAAEAGEVPAPLLREPAVRERLLKDADPALAARLEKLVAGLPDEDAALERLLQERRAAFDPARASKARGLEVFTAACAACHQLDGQGGLVGPQLTGIGGRGVERLCEDILAPNRNVDHAFATTRLTLKDGEVVTGLFRREEGRLLVLANAAGAEFTVPRADVVKREETHRSLMPENYGEALTPEQFNDLLAYLLSARTPQP